MLSCPTCHSTSASEIHRFTAGDAADHLIAERRSPERNAKIRSALTALWGSDHVGIAQCRDCGFAYAHPFRAGSPEIYNLFGGGAQHYPRDRFEFSVTGQSLRERGGAGRLLEIGAGSGAFLKQVRREGLAKEVTATEYDDSAVAALKALGGIDVYQGDFRARVGEMGQFDAICMFQVMEHLDDLDGAFSTLRALLLPGGSVFIGVPNAERIAVQESLTGFMDMPPVHIGRWTSGAMAAISHRHGLTLVDEKVNPTRAAIELRRLANYRLEQRTRNPKNAVSRIEAIQYRPLRGALKRTAAAWDAAMLARHYGKIPAGTRWFRLQAP